MVFQAGLSKWQATDALTVRTVDPLALTPDLAAAWDDLAHHASEPNAFAERWCLAPALQLLDGERQAHLLVVESGDQLVGVAALAMARRYGPLPLRHWVNWLHPNHFHGAPLVRSGFEMAFWQAVTSWCAAQATSGFLLQWRRLTGGGALHRALAELLSLSAADVPVVHQETRAFLDSDLSPEIYWETAVRGKKRKELRRQANRLSEAGPLVHRHWEPGEAVEPWIDTFLVLEASGWKGREGSAMASDPVTEAWVRTIISGARDAGRLDMRILEQKGRPLAILINFLCPPGGFSFKTAFAEDAARFSPGVLLQQANLELLRRDDRIWIDSCAAPDHPMIDGIWRERRDLVWVNVPLGGRRARSQFAMLMRAEALWHRLRHRPAPPPAQESEA